MVKTEREERKVRGTFPPLRRTKDDGNNGEAFSERGVAGCSIFSMQSRERRGDCVKKKGEGKEGRVLIRRSFSPWPRSRRRGCPSCRSMTHWHCAFSPHYVCAREAAGGRKGCRPGHSNGQRRMLWRDRTDEALGPTLGPLECLG